jgi:hypothetical protein
LTYFIIHFADGRIGSVSDSRRWCALIGVSTSHLLRISFYHGIVPRPHPQKRGKGLLHFQWGLLMWHFWILSHQDSCHVAYMYNDIVINYHVTPHYYV